MNRVKSVKLPIASGLVDHCPWNPRGEITPESVKDLTASIKERGLLQDIGVMRVPDYKGGTEYWVIYGNRRFVACREAGIMELNCKLYEVTEAEAREITRIENEVRLGIDPIKDSELVKSMLDLGMTETDIAAHFGVSVPTICRRAKLITLSDEYKAIADKVSTAALENIAAYPEDIQKRCFKSVKGYASNSVTQIGWKNISYQFENESADLDGAHFVQHALKVDSNVPEKCLSCTKRTGCMADLFGELDEEGCLGRCLDIKCFKATEKAFVQSLADAVIDDRATERVRCERTWNMPNGVVDKWGKKNPCAYWCYESYGWKGSKTNGIIVKYGPSAAMIEAMENERRAREEAERKAQNERRQVLESAIEKLEGFISGLGDLRFFEMALEILGNENSTSCRNWFLDALSEFVGRSWQSNIDNRNAEFVHYFTPEAIGLTEEEAKAIADQSNPEESDFEDVKKDNEGDEEDGE